MITTTQMERLKSLLGSGADMDLFFSSIKSVEWLQPLLEHGFFDSPPLPEHGTGWVSFPAWPQSRYLARVAAEVPELALKVALHIPVTENRRVNDDIFGVALALPPLLAAQLLPRITTWVVNDDLRWMAKDVADVIGHTASADYNRASKLLRALISFTADPDRDEKHRIHEAGGMFWGLEPGSRLKVQDYQKLLATAVPPLLRAKPLNTLSLLATVLDRFVVEKTGKDDQLGHDGSIYWRPSISASDQNPDHRPVSYLVSALRDAGENAVKNGWASVDQLLGVSRKFSWHIFRRLELHWVRAFRTQIDPALWKEFLFTEEYFFSGNFDLEYGLLLSDAFDLLTTEEQARIYNWTEQGPPHHELEWMGKDMSGETASTEVVARRIAHWRVKKVFWIKESLNPTLRAQYDRWVAQSGEPEHPGFHVWTGDSEIGVRSPLSNETFQTLSLQQQVVFLQTWEPSSNQWNGPMKEGLAGMFQAEVKTHPIPYFQSADQFIGLDSIYLSGLIRGLAEGLKHHVVSGWEPFWTLVKWIIDQPDPVTELPDEFTQQSRPGRRWQSCRLEITRFLDALLKGATVALPVSERFAVWPVIELLTHDPDPMATDEVNDERTNMDPFTFSLNTVRGEAMHSVFSYIRWVRSHLPKEQHGDQTLDDLPEARDRLETMLDPNVEPTLTVRSVFGANIVSLSFWAEAWLHENLGRIFPADRIELWQIAWETFVGFSSPHAKTLVLLNEQYAAAIARLSIEPKEDGRHEDARVSLGQHLIVNYWWGHLDFATPGDLLAEFFAKAPQVVRAKIMAFVGHSVAQSTKSIPPDIHARLVRFWEWRIGLAVAAKGVGFQDEIANFAWWFDAKKFDEPWAIQQMVIALEFSHADDMQFLWMRRFAEIADQYPHEAVRAMELTLQSVQQKRGQFWEDEDAAAIFLAAVKFGEKSTLQRAKRAQNILLGMGKKHFLHALPLTEIT